MKSEYSALSLAAAGTSAANCVPTARLKSVSERSSPSSTANIRNGSIPLKNSLAVMRGCLLGKSTPQNRLGSTIVTG